ncbi:hypothetical protein BDZ89DRAFT_1062202 [Hymenopellis radicata]|nr:hypothetical protein BDZ89DRAFT_1062202 [Hymenopellis radicata]
MKEECDALRSLENKFRDLVSSHRALPHEFWSDIFLYAPLATARIMKRRCNSYSLSSVVQNLWTSISTMPVPHSTRIGSVTASWTWCCPSNIGGAYVVDDVLAFAVLYAPLRERLPQLGSLTVITFGEAVPVQTLEDCPLLTKVALSCCTVKSFVSTYCGKRTCRPPSLPLMFENSKQIPELSSAILYSLYYGTLYYSVLKNLNLHQP